MNISRRGRWTLIITVSAFILLITGIIVYGILSQQNKKDVANSTYIAGLTDCSNNIDPDIITSIQTQLYTYIKYANNYNKITSLPNYQSSIRKGSCQVLAGSQDGSNTTTTSIIVDVPVAKQSWKVTYSWVPNGTNYTTDLGQITVECPSTSQLQYGDFHCAQVLSLLTNGTAKVDAILQYMPYSGAGFNLTYNPDTKTVAASILVQSDNQGNQTLINNIEAQVQDWFAKRNLAISNYTVVYTVVVDNTNGL